METSNSTHCDQNNYVTISLFVLLGATVLSVLKIRAVRWQNGAAHSEQIVQDQAIRKWWSDHNWGASAVFGTFLALGLFGASWLLFLGQIASFPEVGASDIHFLDQSLVPVIFFVGAVAIVPILLLSSVSWQLWEIPASWVVQSKLDPDFSKVRQLLATEIAGEQTPITLGIAIRVGLMLVDQIDQIKGYHAMRRSMVQSSPNIKPQMLNSLDQLDWMIRAAELRDDLSPAY